MDCKSGGDLLVDYKRAVSVYKYAVRNIPGTDEDSRPAIAEAERLRLGCKDASDALMAYWRQHHAGLAKKPGDS
jgi:hypothetical protein